MMWHEFEELAGYEVTYEDYSKVIEPMYMATELSKQDFIACLDKKRFALPTKAEVVRKMKKIAKHLYKICGHSTDYEAERELDRMAKAYAKRFYGLNWSDDIKAYVYFLRGYEYEEIQRGCTYPRELVIGRNDTDYERIALVK